MPGDTEKTRLNRSHIVTYKTLHHKLLQRLLRRNIFLNTAFGCLLQPFRSYLSVGFGGRDAVVPQELLDQTNIASLVINASGERVSKGMGCNGFVDSGLYNPLANDPLNLSGGQSLVAGISEQWLSRVCPLAQRPECNQDRLANRDNLRISALGLEKGNNSGVPLNVPDIQRDCLTKPAAGRQHEGQQATVAFGPLPFEIEAQQRLDFAAGEDDRGQGSVSFAAKNGGRVSRHQPPRFTPSEQGLQAHSVAVDGRLAPLRSTRANLDAVSGHETGQHSWRDSVDLHSSCKRYEGGEVPPVRTDRVWRPAFSFEVFKKFVGCFLYSHGALLCVVWWLLVMVHTGSWGGLYQVISDGWVIS